MLRDFVVARGAVDDPGETAYRFKHVLIREVAYSGLAKSSRAACHDASRLARGARRRGAARDSRLSPRPGRGAARRARRGGAARARRGGGRRADARGQARARAGGEPRRAAGCWCGRSSSSRRSSGATRPRGPRGGSATSRRSRVEMRRRTRGRTEAGDARIEARALHGARRGLALPRRRRRRGPRAGEPRARARRRPDDEARYDALEMLSLIGWWTGNLTAVERYAREMLELARARAVRTSRRSR